MGASASTEKTQLQKDMEYLGDRMPFGDAELVQVYRVYQKLQQKFYGADDSQQADVSPLNSDNSTSSFLKDIGTLSASEGMKMKPKKRPVAGTAASAPSPEQLATIKKEEDALLEERYYLLEAVERKILPNGFGNTLYRTCFLETSKTSEYEEGWVRGLEAKVDDYARIAKLEKFFEGLANGTRRDRKTVIKCLIKCCEHHPPPPEDTKLSSNNQQSTAANDFAYGRGGYTSNIELINKKTFIDPLELVNLGYRLCLAAAFLKEGWNDGNMDKDNEPDLGRFLPPEDPKTPNHGLNSLANSLASLSTKRKQRMLHTAFPTDELATLVDEDDIFEWVERVAPMFGAILPTFLHALFFPNKVAPPTRSSFDFPRISQESAVFPADNSPLLFSFGCMSPSLGGEFYRLYTSASDGLSFNRLMNALLGYGGPTLLIIQSGKSTFGAFTASPWKESKDFYGNTDCFLYKLLTGTTCVYRPTDGTTPATSRFMYCNSFARSRGFDKQAHGIGFGGSTDKPRLFLAENFDDCFAGSDDLTFEKGPLLDMKPNGGAFRSVKDSMFDIDNLEVWGVGGTDVVEESLKARSRTRDIRQANINKARKVDKAAFLDDLRSGVIDSKAFAHRQQIQGRDAPCELMGEGDES